MLSAFMRAFNGAALLLVLPSDSNTERMRVGA
jgi:hypothetical protein